MLPENMPYYRGPRITSPVTPPIKRLMQPTVTSITCGVNAGTSHLFHVSVRFGDFDTITPASAHASTNHEILCLAQQVMWFGWAVYSFGGGQIASTITSCNFPFCIKLTCDQYELGCAMFREFTLCTKIFNNGNKMLDYICGSGDNSQSPWLSHSFSLV